MIKKKAKKKTAKAVVTRKRSTPDNIIGIVSNETLQNPDSTYLSVNPIQTSVGGFTYNNPTAILPPSDTVPFVSNAPGSPMPTSQPLTPVTLTPAIDSGGIPTATPPFVPENTTALDPNQTVPAALDSKKMWLYIGLAALVVIAIYFYMKKK